MKKSDNTKQEPSFMQYFLNLPLALQKRVVKQFVSCILIVFLTVLCLLIYKHRGYCIGFLIALYLAYLGCDLIWSYYSGKIQCHRMVCIKASRALGQEHVDLVMRELEEGVDAEQAIHKFYLPVSKKDAKMITENTVMHIYLRADQPARIQAWEIIDYTP